MSDLSAAVSAGAGAEDNEKTNPCFLDEASGGENLRIGSCRKDRTVHLVFEYTPRGHPAGRPGIGDRAGRGPGNRLRPTAGPERAAICAAV